MTSVSVAPSLYPPVNPQLFLNSLRMMKQSSLKLSKMEQQEKAQLGPPKGLV